MKISNFQKVLGVLFWLSIIGGLYFHLNPVDRTMPLRIVEFTRYDFWAVPVADANSGALSKMKIQIDTYGEPCSIINKNGTLYVNDVHIGPIFISSGTIPGMIMYDTMAECR